MISAWRSTTFVVGVAGWRCSSGSNRGRGPTPSDPDLWIALRGLGTRTRSALLLNVVDGYTQAEIGRMLSVPEGTVASWIRAVGRRCAGSSIPTDDRGRGSLHHSR